MNDMLCYPSARRRRKLLALFNGRLACSNFTQSKLQLPEDASLEDSEARAQLRLGLFSYPVLQAADILIHRYG